MTSLWGVFSKRSAYQIRLISQRALCTCHYAFSAELLPVHPWHVCSAYPADQLFLKRDDQTSFLMDQILVFDRAFYFYIDSYDPRMFFS